MDKRLRNTLMVIPIYAVAALAFGFIVEGRPVWNLVISSVIAGVVLTAFILPRMEKNRQAKNGLEDNAND